MKQMSSTHAKQNFGELLEALARGPVAVERHGKVKAIVCSPEAFGQRADAGQMLAARRAARAAQQLVEKDRLIRHQKLAIELLLMPKAKRAALVRGARAEVARWRRARLCSPDYADRWEALLDLSVEDLARAMSSDALDEGTALRQNSPWPAVWP
jgi:PHD/YefM family antitoxin component YafN of YafNO toxin-antitoxin module